MSDAPVDPAEVPVFTGDLALLDTKMKALSSGGTKVATAAGDIHSSFGGLRAFYKAPEAEQLFATTKPVVDLGRDLSSDMGVIVGALGAYSHDARPLKDKLDELKREAVAFRAKIADDDKWREDGDLIEENLNRRNKIAEVWTAFQAIETTCHSKIIALVPGGKPLRLNDGSNKEGMYGYDAEALKQSKSLPWGDAVAESVPWWQVWEHAYDFGKGIVVDGVWGTIKGLGTLVGFSGWDAAGQAWTGLAKLATGLVLTGLPVVGVVYSALPDDKLPAWLRDSRTAMKETGKALVAWDQWGENPSRAAGAVTFNVVTTIFTGGVGGAASGAGKAGAVAKAISFAGKAGRAIDPMTYMFKGAAAGFSKIGDVMAGLKGLGHIELPKFPKDTFALPEGSLKLPDGTVRVPAGAAIPEGALRLPNGTVRLPHGTTTLPPGTVRLPVEGAPKYMDPKGNIYDADGAVIQHAKDAPTGRPTSGTPAVRVEPPRVQPPIRTRELAGVGARGGDDVIRLGSDAGDAGRIGSDTPGGRPEGNGGDRTPGGNAGNNMPSNSLDNATTGGRPGDNASGGSHPEGRATGPGSGQSVPHQDGQGGGQDGPGSSDTGAGRGGGSGGSGTGADGPRVPDEPPVYLDGDRVAQQPTGKMAPDREEAVTAALAESKVPPVDQGRMLTQLRKSPYGAAVAEHIASGRFASTPGYKDLIFQVKQSDMMPAVHQALEHAVELQAKKMDNIEFELKLPDQKLDLDVLARSKDGIEYGAQLKDVKSANGIKSAVAGIAEKQLAGPGVKVKAAILDVHDVKGAMTEQIMKRVQRAADRTNASFELRFEDGSVTVFPTNATTP